MELAHDPQPVGPIRLGWSFRVEFGAIGELLTFEMDAIPRPRRFLDDHRPPRRADRRRHHTSWERLPAHRGVRVWVMFERVTQLYAEPDLWGGEAELKRRASQHESSTVERFRCGVCVTYVCAPFREECQDHARRSRGPITGAAQRPSLSGQRA